MSYRCKECDGRGSLPCEDCGPGATIHNCCVSCAEYGGFPMGEEMCSKCGGVGFIYQCALCCQDIESDEETAPTKDGISLIHVDCQYAQDAFREVCATEVRHAS